MHGLVVDMHTTQADGKAERVAAAEMQGDVRSGTQCITVGADKAYDTRGFVKECRALNVTPHVDQNLKHSGGNVIDARTTRHAGYAISQLKRKCIERCINRLVDSAQLPTRFDKRGQNHLAEVILAAILVWLG